MATKRKYYLVDTENTGASWIRELPELGETDLVCLFFTSQSGTYRHEEVQEILKINKSLEWIKCTAGQPNALDFQLVTWLGSRAGAAPKSTYIIVSNDHGYDPVCTFWAERGVAVSRMPVNTARIRYAQDDTEPYTRQHALSHLSRADDPAAPVADLGQWERMLSEEEWMFIFAISLQGIHEFHNIMSYIISKYPTTSKNKLRAAANHLCNMDIVNRECISAQGPREYIFHLTPLGEQVCNAKQKETAGRKGIPEKPSDNTNIIEELEKNRVEVESHKEGKPAQNTPKTDPKPSGTKPEKIPEGIRKSLSSSLKKKYATEENIRLAYQAILSGDLAEIHKAANKVCGSAKDAGKMERHWQNLINSAKKAAGK